MCIGRIQQRHLQQQVQQGQRPQQQQQSAGSSSSGSRTSSNCRSHHEAAATTAAAKAAAISKGSSSSISSSSSSSSGGGKHCGGPATPTRRGEATQPSHSQNCLSYSQVTATTAQFRCLLYQLKCWLFFETRYMRFIGYSCIFHKLSFG